MDTFFQSLLLFSFVGYLILRAANRGKKNSVTITEYQRGVRFRNGLFLDVVGPGFYRFNENKVRIERVDMRPQPLLAEVMQCSDATGSAVVISVAAEFKVSDPRLSVTASKGEEVYARVNRKVREYLSRAVVHDGSSETIKRLNDELKQSVDLDLRLIGICVEYIDITELWRQNPMPTQVSSFAQ